jgi:uncharacterized 2Fe-2S/4Fe-4S cluster protein (DUF4445 family)
MAEVTFLPQQVIVTVPDGSALLDAAKIAGIHAETPCGGRGLCRKCHVRVESGSVEFDYHGKLPEALARDGIVLLCMARLGSGPVTIRAFAAEEEQGHFVSADNDLALVDSALIPESPFSPFVDEMEIQVKPPVSGDGLSDADRLLAAAADLPLPAGGLPVRPDSLTLDMLRKLPETLREKDGRVAIRFMDTGRERILLDVRAKSPEKQYGIAADIGTTTVAVLLADLADGRVIGSKTEYNAQVSCGLDVISRINYARKPQRLQELREKVLGSLNGMIAALAAQHGIDPLEIDNASVAGNTTMIHLLLGIPPEYIRLDPYTPAVYAPPPCKAGDIGIGIWPGTPVFFAPGVGSYIGGDITSGLLCTSLSENDEGISLFIDVGTNGEIILGNPDFLIGCACSAGPAFEGGGIDKGMRASRGAIERAEIDPATGLATFTTIGDVPPVGICGSGMISLVAGLYQSGWLDPDGKLNRLKTCSAIRLDGRFARYVIDSKEQGGAESVYVTENDISNLIRAKAAIFSACRVLLRKVGLDIRDITKIYIAGGFGRYLDLSDAQAIGLLPALPADRYVYVGNASASGAYMTLLSRPHREKCRELARKITYLDLSTVHEYMNEYTAALFIPHTDQQIFSLTDDRE